MLGGRAGDGAVADDGQPQEQQRRPRRLRAEAELYAPVKRFLQARGLDAKGEVRGCDVVAVSPAAPEPPGRRSS